MKGKVIARWSGAGLEGKMKEFKKQCHSCTYVIARYRTPYALVDIINITKIAGQINESFYAEIKVARVRKEMGIEMGKLGAMPIACETEAEN